MTTVVILPLQYSDTTTTVMALLTIKNKLEKLQDKLVNLNVQIDSVNMCTNLLEY